MTALPAVVPHFVLVRFNPIFSLLFGLGFGIFLERAGEKTGHPRLVLLRRLILLGLFGLLHRTLQPGEVLLPYAIYGIVFMLSLSSLPRLANLLMSAALTVVGAALFGGIGVIPGLFVLGFAMSGYRLHETLPQRTRALAVAFACSRCCRGGARAARAPVRAGAVAIVEQILMSFAYMSGFLLLRRTPLERPLDAVFAPLGLTALTNSLMASVLFVTFGALLGLEGSSRWGVAVALTAGIIVCQAALTPWWLRRYRYGPLEWVSRCATWGTGVPLRRALLHEAPAGRS